METEKKNKYFVSNEEKLEMQKLYEEHNSLKAVSKIINRDVETIKRYVNFERKEKLSTKEIKRRRVVAVQKRRTTIKEMAVEYKGGKCVCCDYNKYIGALEFHHLNPNEKDFSISKHGYCRGWEKVKKELDKCVLVCSNCHKEIHAGIINLTNN